MEPLCQWSVAASFRCDPWGSEARPTPDGPLALGAPRSPRPPSGGRGSTRPQSRRAKEPRPRAPPSCPGSQRGCRPRPTAEWPLAPHFSSQHREETQLPLSSAAVASEQYAAHDHRALHTPTLSESAPPPSPPVSQVAVVSCPLLFGKPPVPANSALGARLNAPLIPQFPLGCRLWAAATTLRGPTLQPQPGRGERIVSNSIYVQVEKDCVSPAA